jgi:predicted nucleic-acid-binding protein
MAAERVFADANLFLRYLTNDVPEQADAVESLLQQAAVGELALVTHSMVMAEITWTLESFYELSRPEIKDKILAILNTPGLEVEDGAIVLQAVVEYVDKNVDFIDAYSAAWMILEGLEKVYTFDQRHMGRFAGLKVIVPGQGESGSPPGPAGRELSE